MAEDVVSDSLAAAKRLVVLEVRDETGSPDWRNQLIALGIANLVATELYNTGHYAPIEEKPEILRELNDLQALSWLNKGADIVVNDIPRAEPPKLTEGETVKASAEASSSEASGQSSDTDKRNGQLKDTSQECTQGERPVSLFERFGCDAVARVVVKNFKQRRVRSIGFISGGSTTVGLNVEVSVEERDGGFYRGVGRGEGTTTAMAAMFEIRENRISFDETTVGQATQKAVREAVVNLCKVDK
ncbi:MAG: hypothetical protein ABWK15_01705 [Dissulfuribacterales bacterium]